MKCSRKSKCQKSITLQFSWNKNDNMKKNIRDKIRFVIEIYKGYL